MKIEVCVEVNREEWAAFSSEARELSLLSDREVHRILVNAALYVRAAQNVLNQRQTRSFIFGQNDETD